jgi:hypothetical protein
MSKIRDAPHRARLARPGPPSVALWRAAGGHAFTSVGTGFGCEGRTSARVDPMASVGDPHELEVEASQSGGFYSVYEGFGDVDQTARCLR